jgi:hypothetical protein
VDKIVEAFDSEKGQICNVERGNLKIQIGQSVLACWFINTTNIFVNGASI